MTTTDNATTTAASTRPADTACSLPISTEEFQQRMLKTQQETSLVLQGILAQLKLLRSDQTKQAELLTKTVDDSGVLGRRIVSALGDMWYYHHEADGLRSLGEAGDDARSQLLRAAQEQRGLLSRLGEKTEAENPQK